MTHFYFVDIEGNLFIYGALAKKSRGLSYFYKNFARATFSMLLSKNITLNIMAFSA